MRFRTKFIGLHKKYTNLFVATRVTGGKSGHNSGGYYVARFKCKRSKVKSFKYTLYSIPADIYMVTSLFIKTRGKSHVNYRIGRLGFKACVPAVRGCTPGSLLPFKINDRRDLYKNYYG